MLILLLCKRCNQYIGVYVNGIGCGIVVQPLIEYYDFGYIVVDGKSYSHDIIITPSHVVSDWWRLEGHRLQIPDVRDYLEEDADVVVIGTGYNGMMYVDSDVIEEFRRHGKEVYVARTRIAVEIYNNLVKEGKKVVVFLHLTC